MQIDARVSAHNEQAHAQRKGSALAMPALLLGLFGLALLPRTLMLADFFTTDEAYHWIRRSQGFAAALRAGNWAETFQTGHPGVTLMWLGSLGLGLEQLFGGAGDPLSRLAWMRLPVAIFHAALLPLAYILLRRMLRPAIALTAALLWATSPWLVAQSRLLHLDALLTDFVMLSVLLLLAAARRGSAPAPGWLLGSGAVGGLALLTKGPALILLPAVGLLLFWWIAAARLEQDGRRWWQAVLPAVAQSLVWYVPWLAAAALVVVLLWPVLWVDAGNAVGRYIGEIVDNGGRPNGDGQFFLGRAVGDPGAWFYPLAGLFRLTPQETLGLLLLPAALFGSRRVAGRGERRRLWQLAALLLFWVLMMTLGPKKFDRYILPVWPALLLLCAAGLVSLVDRVQQWIRGRISGGWLIGGLLLPAQLLILLWYHPYYLSYYNPLLGGGPAAQRNLLIGWGEGMNQVAAYLNARPDIRHGQVLAALPPTLQPFLAVPVRNVYTIDNDPPANYAVVYLESVQRGAYPAIYARIRDTVPLHTVRIHGIDYAWIHQLPRPYDQAVDALFADALLLRGVSIAQEAGRITVTPAWDVRAPPPADYLAFVHLIDAQGRRVAQIDVAPAGAAAGSTANWQPGQQLAVPLPMELPSELPNGNYRVVMGLYNPHNGERPEVHGGQPADFEIAGPQALLLTTVQIED